MKDAAGRRDEEADAVRQNEDLVRAIVGRYVPSGSSLYEDALQEGRIALVEAARSWSASGGASFRTWAGPRVEWELLRFVKTASRQGFWSKGGKPKGQWNTKTEAPGIVSLDALGGDNESLHDTLASSVATPEELLGQKQARERLNRAGTVLSSRTVQVLVARCVEGASLQEAGALIGRTRERARQLQAGGLAAMAKNTYLKGVA